MVNSRIPTELIQLFSSKEATNYRIIPFEMQQNNILKCYGDENRDYQKTIQEIAIIYDLNVVIDPVGAQELDKALSFYYRQDRTFSSNAQSLNIGNSDFVSRLIEEADALKSSDIHFEAYEKECRVRFRIDGKLIERYIINKTDYPALINRIKILSNLDISEKRLPQDGRILFERNNLKFDVRVSVMPTIYGEKIVLRLLSKDQGLLSLSRLGFNEKQYADYHRAIMQPNGLILISGPTGSGKSTTLYATLGILNRQDNNILTIEDPVEYILPGINQMQLKEEIGLTFGSALRTFLRQDPDIIMLGEIRDQDTAQMAIRSSLTGHLLLSTIHTNSAWGSITRLIDMGVHPYLISETLIACVAQRLIRLLCPHCKKTFHPDASFTAGYKLDSNNIYYEKTGCEKCYYTGYLGRKAIYEVILIDKYLSQLIRKNETDIGEYLQRHDIKTLKDAALEMFGKGETSLEEILPIVSETI
ncbi:GspE/PulE family protein [Proteiniphilum sp. X52]|uniref:GspE/PulE family protein n=1 Tax=Proteiniphilum sp. X52 TaxID=2382159 RepID=UPI000F0A21EE|nr:GspE/PulE family protein [Proteiniphilum sp. X52]RNC63881.1 type II/IV secretion system protein [Proteiniphilum sp. X52]